MRPAARWPLHPAPADGEALSSWLSRIAAAYAMELPDLIRHGLDDADTTGAQLDQSPPPGLLDRLSQRTGVPPDRVHGMSLAGWTPWLLDSLDAQPRAFEVYVRQFSILLKPGASPRHQVDPWRAWIPEQPQQRACPDCLAEPDHQDLPLMGQLPLMLSCPRHGCLLEPILGVFGDPIWDGPFSTPRAASDPVRAMDQWTHQALTVGHVDLPRRRVHVAVWFRLLRTLLHELSLPATSWGSHARDLRHVWDICRQPSRGGLAVWRPFEVVPWTTQARLLEAAATALDLLGAGLLAGRGAEAPVLTPRPHRLVDVGRLATRPAREKQAIDPWVAMRAAAEEALAAARADPDAARVLYAFLLHGCRDAGAVEQLRADLAQLGVRAEHLSREQRDVTVHGA